MSNWPFLVIFLSLLGSIRPVSAAVVDIMLVYDTTAATWVASNGGMDAFSQDVVSRMNQAMSNSNAGMTFRHVHSMVVQYTTTATPSSGFGNDLTALQAGSGPFVDVHNARDTHHADIVAMVVDHGSAYGQVGLGYLLVSWSGDADYAYSVSAISSVAISHTLTHEVGHNLGLHHSKYQPSPGPNSFLRNPSAPYSAGWYFTASNNTKYHTIMAYQNDGTYVYQEVPLFSSPLSDWSGTTAGDPQDGDNTRLIREIKNVIAGYRNAVAEYSLTVKASGISGVYIAASPSDYAGTSTYTKSGIALNTEITLTAPDNFGGKIFSFWDGCDFTFGSSCKVAMTSDKVLNANYAVRTYMVNIQSSGAFGVMITADPVKYSGVTKYSHTGVLTETSITLQAPASANDTYFSHWTGCDTTAGNSCHLQVTADRSLTANYLPACEQPQYIEVPVENLDGTYAISWSKSRTSDVSFVLEEATDSVFSKDLRTAFSGTATSTIITGRSSGVSYYYRVKATRSRFFDSLWRDGNNACSVSILSNTHTETPSSQPLNEQNFVNISWLLMLLLGI